MAATFQWSESNGAGPTVTDGISNINFGSTDAVNLNTTTYPIIAAQNSYEKYNQGKFSGTFTTISNMKFWKSAGTYVTGEDIKAAVTVTYTQPVATTSTVATVTVPTSVGAALTVLAIGGGATITAPGYTEYIVMQLQTTGSTPSGAVNQKTFTFQYDEV